MTRALVYIASPYSSHDPNVRRVRYIEACRVAGMLMNMGEIVFSPVAHSHGIAEECDLPKGWEFWSAFDRAYLAASKRLVVLCVGGWRESVGVQAEIAIAEEMGIPIEYMEESKKGMDGHAT